MSSVERKARELLADQYENAGMYETSDGLRSGLEPDVHGNLALRAIAAALREQPEARGVVDDAMVDAYLAAQAKAVQAVDDKWGGGGKAASYLHPVREACRAGLTAALTAAQQQGQESEDTDAAYIEELAAMYDPSSNVPEVRELQQKLSRIALRLRTAPPSAPVGVEDSPIDANDNADYIEHCADRLERCGLRITAGALRVIAHEHRALAQQPAQAAPGVVEAPPTKFIDGMGWAVACSDAAQYVASVRSAARALAQQATPPGDDAAGGGHG